MGLDGNEIMTANRTDRHRHTKINITVNEINNPVGKFIDSLMQY